MIFAVKFERWIFGIFFFMMADDEHSLTEIHEVITWATTDEFWRSNIRSARKLRDKYDTLRLRMQSRRNPTPDRNAQIIERAFANYDQPNQRLELEP